MSRTASTPMQNYTEQLARCISAFSYEHLPAEVTHQAKMVLLDTLGAALAASSARYPATRILTEFAQILGGTPESTIIGKDLQTSCVHAALVNGTLAYYCDVESHHPGAILHIAAIVVPSALAVGEREGLPGKQFLASLVLGIEIGCRISYALDPRALYRRGFHPTAVAGCFGAVTTAGYLWGLDVSSFQNALGLTGTQACGLLSWVSDHTENSRPFNPGVAARNGVTAALLAKLGFGGPPDIFGGKYDLFTAFSGERHLEELTAEIGPKYRIMESAFKLYSCCAFLHPGLDGLLKIATTHHLTIEDVEEIILRFAQTGMSVIDNNELKSHCAQYIFPIALLERQVVIDDILQDRRIDPRIQRLSERVQVVGDAELEKTYPDQYRSIIEVVTREGKRFVEQVDWPKGYPQNPLTQAEIEQKFLDLSTPVISLQQAKEVIDLIEHIEEVENIQRLASRLRSKTG